MADPAFSPFGTTTTNVASEPLTIDKLRAMQAKLRDMIAPKQERWLSSPAFPADKALVVESDVETFRGAHPAFWGRVERECSTTPFHRVGLGLAGIQIVEIDAHPSDSAEMAEWRHALKLRFAAALHAAMGGDAQLGPWPKANANG